MNDIWKDWSPLRWLRSKQGQYAGYELGSQDNIRHQYFKASADEIERLRLVEAEARKLVDLLREVGHATGWQDREQTDRVFAWYEFDDLRHALGEGETRPND